MERLAWLTDTHLDFLSPEQGRAFIGGIAERAPDGLLLGGDIAHSSCLAFWLLEMARILDVPVYFVIGNHDCYASSIAATRDLARQLTQDHDHLFWLPAAGPVILTGQTVLLGHDGWADGRNGDFMASPVMLNDYIHIEEFLAEEGKHGRLKRLHQLGDEAAGYFRKHLPRALSLRPHVLLLTHVPPFKEACWHKGRVSDDDFLPHFSARAAGEVMVEIMQRHPQHRLTVLCGHTHSFGQVNILPNLRVITGGADYREPAVQCFFNPDQGPFA